MPMMKLKFLLYDIVKSISIKNKIYAEIENILSIEIIKLCTFIIYFLLFCIHINSDLKK